TVQVIAVGLVGFAAAAVTAGRQDRSAWVSLRLGATRVLDVAKITPTGLVAAVREADPSGRYAMAAVTLPLAQSTDPPVLAVDAARLAPVAIWPQGNVGAPAAAAALHPGAPDPITFQGTAARFDIDVGYYSDTAGVNGVPAIRGDSYAAAVRA